MKKGGKMKAFAGGALALGLIVPMATPAVSYAEVMGEDVVKIRILETTDIHANLVNYDYYQDQETDAYGLVKTAALVMEARGEAKNSLLFDNGDLLQGNPLSDYFAKENPLKEGETHPVYKVMNMMNYDAGNIGNHEFNYGLDFLDQSLEGSAFPYVNSNVYVDDGDDEPSNDVSYFKPYEILERTVVDEEGDEHQIKVGVIGFVPPQIMQWDKANLEGEVIAKDMVESAEKYVPQMKAEGADLIVAIPHSGIGSVTQNGMEENATYDLSKVEGIDALLFGHSHGVFPSDDYAGIEGVDVEKGTINGVPSVMPGYWGSHLGLVDLDIQLKDGKWEVMNAQTSTRGIADDEGNALVDRVEELYEVIEEDHNDTVDWVRSAVGTTTAPINSYFAQVKDDPSIQIVTNAQKWYVENYIEGTEYEGLPVLSAGAPFKAGTRGDSSYYTDIPAGELAIKNVADLYLYPNTLQAVLITGADVKEWLERSAGQFNTIDPDSTEEQSLVNGEFRSYNYDVIDGVTYEIDVTEPLKYDVDGNVIDESANRIKNLQYNGEPIDPEQKFIVATNNYRASGGGGFPGIDGSNIIIESPDENRNVLINYILEEGTINPSADSNWTFAPIDADVNVVFESSPKAQDYLTEDGNIAYAGEGEDGFAKYNLTFEKNEIEEPVVDFSDIEGHWAKEYIEALAAKSVVYGKPDGTFDPEGKVSRAQFAAFLVRSLNLTAEGDNYFDDVTGTYAAEINAAYEAGITTGITENTFAPYREITREQMAVMLVRAYNHKNNTEYKPEITRNYNDQYLIYFTEEVSTVTKLGYMKGFNNGDFGPQHPATRAQAAKVIYMLLEE
ncbi:bifunctional 2',3'-cyclic-nucleotide 2'-phosphodiesterase/3'-nucleotidase [Jeotgalibacillus salarius]